MANWRDYRTWGASQNSAFYDWMKANYPETVRDYEDAEFYDDTLAAFVASFGATHVIARFQAEQESAQETDEGSDG